MLLYLIHIYTQVYNHKIQVKVDFGKTPPISLEIMALFNLNFASSSSLSFENITVLIYILYTGI